MSKLIHTNLLRKYHNTAECALATSSVLGYCLHRRRNLLTELSPASIAKMFLDAIFALLQAIVGLFCIITGGFFLFPLYAIHHHSLKKELIKKYGVDRINEIAKKLELKRLK